MPTNRVTLAAQAFGYQLADLPAGPADPIIEVCADIITRFPTHRTARAIAADLLHGGGLPGSDADLYGITDHAHSLFMRWLSLHLPAKTTWRPAMVGLQHGSTVMYPAQADSNDFGELLAVRFTRTIAAQIATDLPDIAPGWQLTNHHDGTWTLTGNADERVTYSPDTDGMLRIGSGVLPWAADDGAVHRRVAVSMRPLRSTESTTHLLYHLYLHELPHLAEHIAADKIYHWAESNQFHPSRAAALAQALDSPDPGVAMRLLPRPAPDTVTAAAAQMWDAARDAVPGSTGLSQLQADDALSMLWMLLRHNLINHARRVLTAALAEQPDTTAPREQR